MAVTGQETVYMLIVGYVTGPASAGAGYSAKYPHASRGIIRV